MINVIKHSKTHRTVECPNCNAVFECELTDLTYDYDIDRDTTSYSVKCPECGHKFITHYFKEGN